MTTSKLKNLSLSFLNDKSKIEDKKQVFEYLQNLPKFTTKSKAKKLTGLSYLGGVNSSAKIEKNKIENYNTYIIYLSPSNLSGFNTCPKASQGCIKLCLNTSGRVIMDKKRIIENSRLLKTLLFYANRDFFNAWMFSEIEAEKNKAEKNGVNFSVRINGTSDLSLKLFNHNKINVLDYFKTVQFYDYSKVFNRLEKNKHENYHITFSHSGENDAEVKKALKLGFNVAIPFFLGKNEKLPAEFNGFKVTDADKTDLRFLDVHPIAGLKVKRTIGGKKALNEAINNGFVVNPN